MGERPLSPPADDRTRRFWIGAAILLAICPLLWMGLRAAIPFLEVLLAPRPARRRSSIPKSPDAFAALTRKGGRLRLEITVRNPSAEPIRAALVNSVDVERVSPTGLPVTVGGVDAGRSKSFFFSLPDHLKGLPDATVKVHFMYENSKGKLQGFGSSFVVAIQ